MAFLFEPPARPSLPVRGRRGHFPVHRIYCVGRNYAAHAREMGAEPDAGPPMFFTKPADAVVPGGGEVPWPMATAELHHEVEWVLALHRGGRNLEREAALACVFGHGVGLDLTRRDLQARAKAAGHPWDAAKGFDHSAPVSELVALDGAPLPASAPLSLDINGERRQHGDIADMLFDPGRILMELSRLWCLQPGDLVFTGTPAGVAALAPGDHFHARLGGHVSVQGHFGAPA